MDTHIPIIVDGQAGIFAHSKAKIAELNARAKERLCLMDARMRTFMAEPEEGAAVVIVTHNSAIAPIADRVIHMHNARVKSIEVNEHPMDIKDLEW